MTQSIDFEFIHTEIREKQDKKAVLLFHGLTGSPFEMRKYGDFLFKNGYDVFCYSFPGHGDRISEIETVTWTDWCDFAQDKYNKLRSNYNQFFVSGLCLGASMAVYLAEHNNGEYIPLMDIAKRQEISEKYLESIVSVLSKQKFVKALRGKGGGCQETGT